MQIAEALSGLVAPIESFVSLKDNPRIGNVAAVSKSLEAFGQRKPIVFRSSIDPETKEESKVVIAGNHTLEAAKELGWEHIAAADASDLSEDEAKAYALADNRTSDLGDYDRVALNEYLTALADTGDVALLYAASYEQNEIDLALVSAPPEGFEGLLTEMIGDDKASWSEDVQVGISTAAGRVPLTVMVLVEQRTEIMKLLKENVEAGIYPDTGLALYHAVIS